MWQSFVKAIRQPPCLEEKRQQVKFLARHAPLYLLFFAQAIDMMGAGQRCPKTPRGMSLETRILKQDTSLRFEGGIQIQTGISESQVGFCLLRSDRLYLGKRSCWSKWNSFELGWTPSLGQKQLDFVFWCFDWLDLVLLVNDQPAIKCRPPSDRWSANSY